MIGRRLLEICRWGAITFLMAIGLLLPGQVKAGVNVLVLWDTLGGGTPAMVNALEGAGMAVTLAPVSEYQYDGTNPSPEGFDAVVHMNGTTHSSDMPAAGQLALVNYVANGGAFLHEEWNAYEILYGRMKHMRDLTLFDRTSGTTTTITLTEVAAMADHEILANVPATFSFWAGSNVGQMHLFADNPATLLMIDQSGNAAVAIREFGLGRVVGFHHAGNYANSNVLADTNIQQLYIDSIYWGAKAGDPDNDGVPNYEDVCPFVYSENAFGTAGSAEPDSFTDETLVNNAFPGITLSRTSANYPLVYARSVTKDTKGYGYASTGTMVFGRQGSMGGYLWAGESQYNPTGDQKLRIDFDVPTGMVQIDALSADNYDESRLDAFDASGNLLGSHHMVMTGGAGSSYTLKVEVAGANIAYAMAYGTGNSPSHPGWANGVNLDNLQWGVAADNDADGTADAMDGCLCDPAKIGPGQCGCDAPDTDSDGDGTADCLDNCPGDFNPDQAESEQCAGSGEISTLTVQYEMDVVDLDLAKSYSGDFDCMPWTGCSPGWDFKFAYNGNFVPHAVLFQNQYYEAFFFSEFGLPAPVNQNADVAHVWNVPFEQVSTTGLAMPATTAPLKSTPTNWMWTAMGLAMPATSAPTTRAKPRPASAAAAWPMSTPMAIRSWTATIAGLATHLSMRGPPSSATAKTTIAMARLTRTWATPLVVSARALTRSTTVTTGSQRFVIPLPGPYQSHVTTSTMTVTAWWTMGLMPMAIPSPIALTTAPETSIPTRPRANSARAVVRSQP
jgi:hypothetical protein